MQIRQATAKEFNIENIYDPEQNIKAGTLMIRRLSRIYSGLGLDSINSLKFILAAYNAGEGRVEDLRKYAGHKGADPNNWESVVNLIPSMRHSEISSGLLRLGCSTEKRLSVLLRRFWKDMNTTVSSSDGLSLDCHTVPRIDP